LSNQLSTSQRLQESLGNIISGLKPGDRLPSEPKLAQQLGVSRATLREGMRTFETQGVIRRRQGAGTYVMQPSPVIESGLEVLESIETLAKRIGLDVSMGEMRVTLRPAIATEKQALELEGENNIIHLARLIQADGRPAAYLIDILPEDIIRPIELENAFSGSVLDMLLKRGTPELISSRCEITAVPASHDIARALQIQRGDVLLCFTAWLYSATGRVIDFSYSFFLPGYFRFHVVRRIGRQTLGL
jgi:GntR family transcriptional regulator